MAEKIFGHTITNSDGREVMVRYIGEQHVQEDLGRIPSIADWFRQIQVQSWMYGRRKSLEKELAEAEAAEANPTYEWVGSPVEGETLS